MREDSVTYCNFINLLDITEVLPFSDWTSDPEASCDFVVLVREVPPPEEVVSVTTPLPEKNFILSSLHLFKKQEEQDSFAIKEQHYRLRPRPYILRAIDVVERNQWMRDIRRATRLLKKEVADREARPKWRKWQERVRTMYLRQEVQTLSSGLIIANFFMNAYEAQVQLMILCLHSWEAWRVRLSVITTEFCKP